jgi:hypothetical protein
LLTDRRATICSVLKVVYFLRKVWGIFLHYHTQTADPKQGIKKFLTFTNYFRIITNLTKFDVPLPRDIDISNMANDKQKNQAWDFEGCSGRFQIFVRLVIVRTGVMGKCLRLKFFFIPCFGSGCVWEWRNIPQNHAQFFRALEIYNF